ncbi:MFS transporter [Siccirubricoccus sp. G192]|uniref:MFS transporter n=1 Tax=Siccirubricoccus sp. G192 TaxID=2849651 RepID=UPI001C2BEA8E|nr:MFS transporter [Siccirubricoccus sp. G192]MBV1799721.1 MFS transporter [Siccirubricoccus sp. G192]
MPSPITRLAAAAASAHAADQLALAALPLLATLSLGAGPGLVGLLVAAQSAAWLLVSLPAGALVDRADRRHLMIRAQCATGLALLLAALAGWWGATPLLGLAAFLGSAGTVVFALAAFAAVPALAARGGEALVPANARLELARALATLAAPVLAGLLAARAGEPALALLAAGLAALGAAAIAARGLPALPPASSPNRPPVGRAIAEGAGFVWRQPLLRAVALCAIAWNGSFMALTAVFVPFALTRLGLDAAGAGTALAGYGAGLVLGALAAGRLTRHLAPRALLVAGPGLSVVAAGAMLAAPALPGLLLPGLTWFLLGFGPMLWQVAQTSLRQAVAPAALLGRVGATMQAAIFGARPLGALAGGAVAAMAGLEAAMALAAGGFCLSLAVVLATPLARLRALPAPA